MGKLRNARRKPGATLEDLKDSHWNGGRFEHRGEEFRVEVVGNKSRAWMVRSAGGVLYRANVWHGQVDLELML